MSFGCKRSCSSARRLSNFNSNVPQGVSTLLVDNFCYGFYLLGFFLQWFIVFRHYCVVVDIFGMFFEVWASIYYMLYAFYCCRAPSALGIFVHTFVIISPKFDAAAASAAARQGLCFT